MLTLAVQAVLLFIVTTIDDLIVLSLFFGRGRGQPGTTRRIMLGQYLGFSAILITSLIAALGAQRLLPQEALAYLGVIPLALGLRAAWRSWRTPDHDDEAQFGAKRVTVTAVALVTVANSSGDIGVYVPVFVTLTGGEVLVCCLIFLVLVAALVLAARWIASRRLIADVLDRWQSVLFPVVLIALGIIILVTGGAFGL
ncbi:cadmium resistance transporter [Garicola koreensis]|uniref:Cadmium resistance protein CadD (Predicted permease) n=1 Tax=Garicola koreensis TaxID=1262554 RepID=A0A7W5TSK0_9MICC|nr:cadmium resistance transporter [Garicola koreensis]MBB3666598.1 cadmium resistance protein CadD (predicted permease) [Garicola koreensis]